MNLNYINESFNKKFSKLLEEAEMEQDYSASASENLRKSLEDAKTQLVDSQERNIKAYEIAFQNVIEEMYPEKSWWEITDCNIFWTLFETRSPEDTIDCIIEKLKPEYQ